MLVDVEGVVVDGVEAGAVGEEVGEAAVVLGVFCGGGEKKEWLSAGFSYVFSRRIDRWTGRK